MPSNRRLVIAGIVAILGVLTGAILLDVLGTILFALTVAYVLIPVHGWLIRRGLTDRMAAIAATTLGFVTVLAVFSPIFLTLYLRLEELEALVRSLPSEIVIDVYDQTYTLEAGEVQSFALSWLSDVAIAFASDLPVLAIKFALFVILLFALLRKGDAAGRAAIAPVPHGYRDIVYALAQRARETLYAIYVLQLATSVATLLIGYPLFWALGYDMAFTLAMIAAILQFVPIIGPSLLIAPIAIYHVAVGELVAGILVGVLGVALIAWFPDVGVRPYFSRRSANLPGSLYFVGFTGGLFTLGPIGIVVGPLIVAVFVEAVDLLGDEVNGDRTFTEIVEETADLEASGFEPKEPAQSEDSSDDPESRPAGNG
ncbi:AI-2E family transporter [Halostagnicola bangensis]